MADAAGDPNNELGRRLRARRQELHYSLRDLAERTGLSTASISQIERNLSAPSLRSLRAICTALGMSMGELFSEPGDGLPEGGDTVLRPGSRRCIDFGAKGVSLELLTPMSLRELQVMTIAVQPGCGSSDLPITASLGHHAGLVRKGSLGLEVDDRGFFLNQHDSFGFRAQRSIRFWCASETPCEVTWATTPSVY